MINMATIKDLKEQMNTVPDHKIYHDKPMKGPLKEKKQNVAQKMHHDVSKEYDAKKGGSAWRAKIDRESKR